MNELVFILERIFYDKIILIGGIYSVDFQLIQVKNLQDDNGYLMALIFVWYVSRKI